MIEKFESPCHPKINQMKKVLWLMIPFIFITCNESKTNSKSITNEKSEATPLDQLQKVDMLLADLAEKPQKLSVPSNKPMSVTGKKGTVIHVNPSSLETADGSKLGKTIEIELLEMQDNSSLLLNNAPTVSNGEILVTGGAYYLNMTSDGKQLKIKDGNSLEVEFPKLSNENMFVFTGIRDNLGQINWAQTNNSFEEKNLQKPTKPKAEKKTYSEIDLIFGHIDNEQVEPLTQEQIEEYERKQREYEIAERTYKSIELTGFGMINCDRFLRDSNPKIDIEIVIKNKEIKSARIFAVFHDIESVMPCNYWKKMTDKPMFNNIPSKSEITIIALAVEKDQSYIFESSVNTSDQSIIEIEFVPASKDEIKRKIKSIK